MLSEKSKKEIKKIVKENKKWTDKLEEYDRTITPEVRKAASEEHSHTPRVNDTKLIQKKGNNLREVPLESGNFSPEISEAVEKVIQKARQTPFGEMVGFNYMEHDDNELLNVYERHIAKLGIQQGRTEQWKHHKNWECRITELKKAWEEGCADGLKRGRDEVLEACKKKIMRIYEGEMAKVIWFNDFEAIRKKFIKSKDSK
jgi:hypothetical protein